MKNELEFAKKLAYDAGEIIKKYFNQSDISRYKSDNTIVTKADEEINQMVIDRVRENYPEHGIYGEEDSFGKDRSTLWVCDPLDGTAAFTRGLPIAVFSLALVIDGQSILGVVNDPFTDRLYFATKDSGAFCNDKKISVNKNRLGERDSTIDCSYSPKRNRFNLTKVFYELQQTNRISGLGSVVRAGIMVAEGSIIASIYCSPKPYDIAALKIIVEEAGGRVTDIYGNDQRYDRGIQGAIISNGIVHDEIVKTIKDEK